MSERAMLVVYDIPEEAEMDNPSAEFRQFAFRINLSCWIMREGDMPLAAATLNRIRELGGNWHSLPFADDSGDTILQLGTAFIGGEIAEHMQRAALSAGRNLRRLRDATDWQAAFRLYRNRSGQVTRRLNVLMRDMRRLAARWGLNTYQVGLVPAMGKIAALQSRMYQEMQNYVRATKALEQIPNHPLAAAARAGTVPLGILADALDEADARDAAGNLVSDGMRV